MNLEETIKSHWWLGSCPFCDKVGKVNGTIFIIKSGGYVCVNLAGSHHHHHQFEDDDVEIINGMVRKIDI